MIKVYTQPLSQELFAPFGDVIEVSGTPDKMINKAMCGRFHDRAHLQTDPEGRLGLSLFQSQSFALPLMLEMVERHPLGSQAFIPMHQNPFLVIVAPDQAGQPGTPLAFVTNGAQAVNIGRDIWHGVLTPLADPGLFTVIDRIGSGNNLEEFWYKTPFRIIPN